MNQIAMLHAALLRKPLWIREGRDVTVSVTTETSLHMFGIFSEMDFCVVAAVIGLSFLSGF